MKPAAPLARGKSQALFLTLKSPHLFSKKRLKKKQTQNPAAITHLSFLFAFCIIMINKILVHLA